MTIFNDALNYGIVLVIFAPMLLGHSPIFLSGASEDFRTVMLGFLFSASPLGQLLSSPFFGALSDSWGRKKVLLLTLWGIFLCTILSAIAILMQVLPLLFLGRFLSGCMSGNATLAQAAVADLSNQQTKTKNLAIVGIAGGLAWIIGAPLGGILSDPSLVSWFNFSTPIWFLAIMFMLNAILAHRNLKETYPQGHSEFKSFAQECRNIVSMFKSPELKVPLIYMLLFYIGWFMYLTFFPTLLIAKFQFTQTSIGFISGWCSVAFMAGSLLVSKKLSHRYAPKYLLLWPSIISFIGVFLSAIAPSYYYLIVLFAFANFCAAIIWIASLSLISNLAGKENQGKTFGVQQALLSFGTLVAPSISGFFAAIYVGLPLIVGAILLMVGALVYKQLFLKKAIS